MDYSKVVKLAKLFNKKAYINPELSEERLREVAQESKRVFDERKEALMSMREEDPEFFSMVLNELKQTVAEVKAAAEEENVSEAFVEAEVMNIAAEVLDYPEIIERVR